MSQLVRKQKPEDRERSARGGAQPLCSACLQGSDPPWSLEQWSVRAMGPGLPLIPLVPHRSGFFKVGLDSASPLD